MALTFQADLLHTTLEDFDSHFCVLLNYIEGFMRRQPGVPPITFSGMRTEEFTEDKSTSVYPDGTNLRANHTDYENAKTVLAQQMDSYKAAPEGKAGRLGYIQVIRSVRGPRITYEAVLLAVVRNGIIEELLDDPAYFVLYAGRYRQDMVMLLIDEADAENKPYTKRLQEWLDNRWDEAVRPRKLDNDEVSLAKASSQRQTFPSIENRATRGRPSDQLYDEMYEELSEDVNWQEKDNDKFAQVYGWWLKRIGKKHTKALRSQFRKAMKRKADKGLEPK